MVACEVMLISESNMITKLRAMHSSSSQTMMDLCMPCEDQVNVLHHLTGKFYDEPTAWLLGTFQCKVFTWLITLFFELIPDQICLTLMRAVLEALSVTSWALEKILRGPLIFIDDPFILIYFLNICQVFQTSVSHEIFKHQI